VIWGQLDRRSGKSGGMFVMISRAVVRYEATRQER
jgi:hypothetical protein